MKIACYSRNIRCHFRFVRNEIEFMKFSVLSKKKNLFLFIGFDNIIQIHWKYVEHEKFIAHQWIKWIQFYDQEPVDLHILIKKITFSVKNIFVVFLTSTWIPCNFRISPQSFIVKQYKMIEIAQHNKMVLIGKWLDGMQRIRRNKKFNAWERKQTIVLV